MDTTGLGVSIHAIKQYMWRLEGKPVPDNFFIGDELQEKYSRLILAAVANGREVPTAYCTLFVKVSRGGPHDHQRAMKALASDDMSAGATGWGTYVYDGDAIFIIEDQKVVTVIWPTMQQYTTLEAIMPAEQSAEQPTTQPLALPL